MSSVHHHRAQGPQRCRVSVCTVSDTRTEETDTSGALIKKLLEDSGHEVASYQIVPDEHVPVRAAYETARENTEVDAIIYTGGTGISPRDITPDVIGSLEELRILPGFGELFRALSYEEIGSAAMLSRAMAGVAGDLLVVVLPGSRPAVRLGMERLLLPELSHLVGLARPELEDSDGSATR